MKKIDKKIILKELFLNGKITQKQYLLLILQLKRDRST